MTGTGSSRRTSCRPRWTPAGSKVTDREGVVFNPLTDEWRRASDLSVNYMMVAEKGPD